MYHLLGFFECLFMFWLYKHLPPKKALNSKESVKGYERIIQEILRRSCYTLFICPWKIDLVHAIESSKTSINNYAISHSQKSCKFCRWRNPCSKEIAITKRRLIFHFWKIHFIRDIQLYFIYIFFRETLLPNIENRACKWHGKC